MLSKSHSIQVPKVGNLANTGCYENSCSGSTQPVYLTEGSKSENIEFHWDFLNAITSTTTFKNMAFTVDLNKLFYMYTLE